jgi:hypothetical protein
MRIRKYYAILQEKTKDIKGETVIKEYVYPCEGFAPVVAKRQALEHAREIGMKVVSFNSFQN